MQDEHTLRLLPVEQRLLFTIISCIESALTRMTDTMYQMKRTDIMLTSKMSYFEGLCQDFEFTTQNVNELETCFLPAAAEKPKKRLEALRTECVKEFGSDKLPESFRKELPFD